MRLRRRTIAAYRLAAWHRQESFKPKVLTHSGYLSLTHTRVSAPLRGSEARLLFGIVAKAFYRAAQPKGRRKDGAAHAHFVVICYGISGGSVVGGSGHCLAFVPLRCRSTLTWPESVTLGRALQVAD